MEKFPIFWFEGNLYFNWIKSLADLSHLFEMYEGSEDIDSVLDKAVVAPRTTEYHKYGFRSECDGNKTLRQFLIEKGLNIPNANELSIKRYISQLKVINQVEGTVPLNETEEYIKALEIIKKTE